jgi:hypothetical protein
MIAEWTKQDSELAEKAGWNVFEIWDDRLHLEIQKDDKSNIFLNDVIAREFVKERANRLSNRCPLSYKAWTLVFKSKIDQPETKGRRKR